MQMYSHWFIRIYHEKISRKKSSLGALRQRTTRKKRETTKRRKKKKKKQTEIFMLFFNSINFLFIRKNIKRKTLNTNKSKEYDWLIIKKKLSQRT